MKILSLAWLVLLLSFELLSYSPCGSAFAPQAKDFKLSLEKQIQLQEADEAKAKLEKGHGGASTMAHLLSNQEKKAVYGGANMIHDHPPKGHSGASSFHGQEAFCHGVFLSLIFFLVF
ncbi:hypothetical protein RJ641_025434 [Dillenia turbinata]|uniref:Uncharacterized protein n=1 Tax=Dillenia turbinata TaxID=194707 RepID=A0AAN8W9S9_9MAGN